MAEAQTYRNLGPTLQIETTAVRRCPYQPRTYFDPVKLNQLARSIQKVGQKRPGLVRILSPEEMETEPDKTIKFELVDGERRWLSCKIAGVAYKAYAMRINSEAEIFEYSAVSNFGGEGHTPLEIAYALERIKREQRGEECSIADLADIFAKSSAWVSQHLNLLKLSPEVKKMLSPEIPEKKRLKFSIAKALPVLPHELQNSAARHIMENKLRLFAAMTYIRDLADANNIPRTTRKRRTPRADYVVLTNYLIQTEQKGDGLLNIPHARFREMLENRTHEELAELEKRFSGCRENLVLLEDIIRNAAKALK